MANRTNRKVNQAGERIRELTRENNALHARIGELETQLAEVEERCKILLVDVPPLTELLAPPEDQNDARR